MVISFLISPSQGCSEPVPLSSRRASLGNVTGFPKKSRNKPPVKFKGHVHRNNSKEGNKRSPPNHFQSWIWLFLDSQCLCPKQMNFHNVSSNIGVKLIPKIPSRKTKELPAVWNWMIYLRLESSLHNQSESQVYKNSYVFLVLTGCSGYCSARARKRAHSSAFNGSDKKICLARSLLWYLALSFKLTHASCPRTGSVRARCLFPDGRCGHITYLGGHIRVSCFRNHKFKERECLVQDLAENLGHLWANQWCWLESQAWRSPRNALPKYIPIFASAPALPSDTPTTCPNLKQSFHIMFS